LRASHRKRKVKTKEKSLPQHKELDRMLNVAVVIATPTPTHFDLAKMALQVDKHVLVEKPLALDYGRAQESLDKGGIPVRMKESD